MGTLTAPETETRLASARRLVIKIGSALLVDPEDGHFRTEWVAGLAEDLAALRARGQEVLVVSSGSIALGRQVLGLPPGPLSIETAQAAAAIGQTRLIRAWEEALAAHGLMTAQVLLTLADTQQRRRYLNARATLAALLAHGAIPVINENDTVATDEIRYGDNDRLAARVALMADADVLVLLSDVDGLYTANPKADPQATHLAEVAAITPEIEAMASGAGSALARGGMQTKLLAAKTAMQGGCAMAVTLGDVMRPLSQLENGGRATWFLPSASPAAARKQWIAGMKPMGRIDIDAGAAAALRRGKSLLPAGVRRIDGDFERGDPVTIIDDSGQAIGAALVGYCADDARAIAGIRSDRIEAVLGHPGRAAMAHRDDMVIWGE
ncbi:MAG TPA: glutamate 5-kinase [Paracoccaceae bacterium]|nr:glutamate 5-kinase [Paracoccaceae bacterium]